MFGRKKKQKTTQSETGNKPVYQDDSGNYHYDEVQATRSKLNFFGKFAGDHEIDIMIKMKKSAADINKHLRLRFTACCIFAFLFAYLAFRFKSATMLLIIFGLLFVGGYWFIDMRKVNDLYQVYSIQRQIAFSRFVQITAAYAPEAQTGISMFSILKKVIPRMYDQEDKDNLSRLLVDVYNDPDNRQPFADFANAYPVSESAMTVMLVIQRMFQGDVSDENIRALADDANEEVTKQMGTIITRKLSRMDSTNTQMALAALIPVMTYIVVWVVQLLAKLLSNMSFK